MKLPSPMATWAHLWEIAFSGQSRDAASEAQGRNAAVPEKLAESASCGQLAYGDQAPP